MLRGTETCRGSHAGGWRTQPRRRAWASLCWFLLGGGIGCGDPEETPRVELLVATDAGLTGATTDLRYEIELDHARLVVRDIEFTMAGEAHSARWHWTDALLSTAFAHPGHLQNGDATGVLPGRRVVEWSEATHSLGMATLLVGSYASANFTFGTGEPSDGITAEDAPWQHTAWLRGTASRDGTSFVFEAAVDAPSDRRLVGIPFAEEVTESMPSQIDFRLLLRDPVEGDTLFDGIDFAALDDEQDGRVELTPAASSPAHELAYDVLRRRLLTHDHYVFAGVSPET